MSAQQTMIVMMLLACIMFFFASPINAQYYESEVYAGTAEQGFTAMLLIAILAVIGMVF